MKDHEFMKKRMIDMNSAELKAAVKIKEKWERVSTNKKLNKEKKEIEKFNSLSPFGKSYVIFGAAVIWDIIRKAGLVKGKFSVPRAFEKGLIANTKIIYIDKKETAKERTKRLKGKSMFEIIKKSH